MPRIKIEYSDPNSNKDFEYEYNFGNDTYDDFIPLPEMPSEPPIVGSWAEY